MSLNLVKDNIVLIFIHIYRNSANIL